MTDSQKTIVGFDPGRITGVAEGVFSDTEPLTIVDGVALEYETVRNGLPFMFDVPRDFIVSEVWVDVENEFAPDTIGVRIEGMLDLLYPGEVHWRPRTKKSQVSDDLLREHGLWVTGSDVDWSDGRDVNDAINHILGFVAFDLKHRPTLRKYFR